MATFVRLLGPPSIQHGDNELVPAPGKTSSLLYFLAYRRNWVSRDEIMVLLYPETEEPRARQNLRSLLRMVRRMAGTEDIEIEPGRVRWPVATDVEAFHEAFESGRLPLAVNLYRGPLLEGFTPTPTEAFEAWLLQARQEVAGRWHDIVVELAATLDQQGSHLQAASLLEKAQHADPLDEPTLRSQLRALANAGDRTAALAAFEAFAERLANELGVEPEDATKQLAEQLRSGPLDDPRSDEPAGGEPGDRRHSRGDRRTGRRGTLHQEDLDDVSNDGAVIAHGQGTRGGSVVSRRRRPLPPRPFIGREADLTTALARLEDANCRLLSLVGAGGMGKTALALELAWRLDPDDLGRVAFVPLETSTCADDAVAMIGDAIGLTFFGRVAPKVQLLDALASGTLIAHGAVLILDNLEHLPDMPGLVNEILEQATRLKLVTTSRQPLGLREEWIIKVLGLPFEGNAGLDAALLFDAAARRVHAGFDLAEELDAVVEICRLVGGTPLALELAAAWTSTLGASDIAASLAGSLALLDLDVADRPPRHAGMRTVLDATWIRLDGTEQAAFARLAAFVGGFSVEAAQRVADIDPPMLRRLVTHALLWRQEDGRFAQHPLLARYARERASADAEAWQATCERHATYFAARLESIATAFGGAFGMARTEELADVPNFLQAWAWATDRRRSDLLVQGVEGLVAVARASQRPQEASRAVAQATEVTSPDSADQARLFRALGDLQHWSLESHAAVTSLRRSAAILENLGERRELGRTLASLAIAGAFDDQGSVDLPHTLVRCIDICREFGDAVGEGHALVNLAEHIVDPHEREGTLRSAVDLLRSDRGSFSLTLALHNLAHTQQYAFGAYASARSLLDEAIAIERRSGPEFRLAWWRLARIELGLDQGKVDALDEQLAEAETVTANLGTGFASFVAGYAAVIRGRVSLTQGQPERAMDLLGRVWRGESGRSDPHGDRIGAASWYAVAALRAGRPREAEEAALAALAAAPAPDAPSSYEQWPCGTVAATVLIGLQAERGELAAAAAVLGSALEAVRTLQLLPSALQLCLAAAHRSAATGDATAERSLLELVAAHPAATAFTRNEATRRLVHLGAAAPLERADVPLEVVLRALASSVAPAMSDAS